jgi:hypothetical protein
MYQKTCFKKGKKKDEAEFEFLNNNIPYNRDNRCIQENQCEAYSAV